MVFSPHELELLDDAIFNYTQIVRERLGEGYYLGSAELMMEATLTDLEALCARLDNFRDQAAAPGVLPG